VMGGALRAESGSSCAFVPRFGNFYSMRECM
jgi:hypothetical protein